MYKIRFKIHIFLLQNMNYCLILVLVLFILALLFALKSERLDLFCPNNKYVKGVCGDGKSKLYIQGIGSEKDSVEELLNKTSSITHASSKIVKWRRSFIFTCIIMLLVLLLIVKRQPTCPEVILLFFIVFVPIYFSYSFYFQHFDRFPSEYMDKNIALIRQKLKLGHDVKIVI